MGEEEMLNWILVTDLLQMALTIAMDKPKSLDGDGIRDCKVSLSSLFPS